MPLSIKGFGEQPNTKLYHDNLHGWSEEWNRTLWHNSFTLIYYINHFFLCTSYWDSLMDKRCFTVQKKFRIKSMFLPLASLFLSFLKVSQKALRSVFDNMMLISLTPSILVNLFFPKKFRWMNSICCVNVANINALYILNIGIFLKWTTFGQLATSSVITLFVQQNH